MYFPRYFASELAPPSQAFHRKDASHYSLSGEYCQGTGQRAHGGCLLVPWWQAAQCGCSTIGPTCLESLFWVAHHHPTHQAHDAPLVVLDSMPGAGQGRKELACLHHFICFQCSCFLQLLMDAVLLHCNLDGLIVSIYAMLFNVVHIVRYVCFYFIWQLPNQCLAVAKPESTRVWQLPNLGVAAAKSEFGRR